MTAQLLFFQTKFLIPPRRRESVSRPRLIARLNEGLWSAGAAVSSSCPAVSGFC